MNGNKQKDGRLLSYQLTTPDEKISKFKLRVNEQISVLRVAIKKGSVNDPKTCENYIRKIERFLACPFLSETKNDDKRLIDLKKYLKIKVADDKNISDIIQSWLELKRSAKVIIANTYILQDGSYQNFYYPYEIVKFYDRDLEFLRTKKTVFESQLILVRKVSGLLSDKEFLKALGCKNSWKVSTLKEELSEWVKDFPLNAEFELDEIYKLPYFKYKKYLTMEVRDFVELIKVKAKSLEEIVDWINEEIIEINKAKKEAEDNIESLRDKNIYDLYKLFDAFIAKYATSKRVFDEQYSLYRFGQGLIEADIFAPLYK